LSFHSGALSRASRPSASSSTVPCIWPHAATMAMRSRASGCVCNTARTARTVPAHQSAGRCSDQPKAGTICSCSCAEMATMRPCASTRAARTLPVPMSSASVSSSFVDVAI